MAEVFLVVVVFMVIVAVTMLIFGGWIILKVFSGVGSLLGVGSRTFPQRPVQGGVAVQSREVVQCRVAGCRHFNPAKARFCRHCGHALTNAQFLAA